VEIKGGNMEYKIPDSEFKKRWEKVVSGVRKKGIDILIVHSNEADFANVRYLSDYWPIFETAGVAVSKKVKLLYLLVQKVKHLQKTGVK
jgi:hypothetical protein